MKNISLNGDETENKIINREKNMITKMVKSQEISYKYKNMKLNLNNINENQDKLKENTISKSSVNNIKNQKLQLRDSNDKSLTKQNIPNKKRMNSALIDFSRSKRNIISGDLTFRNNNLKLFNSLDIRKNINSENNRKQSYFIFNSKLRPFTNDKISKKSRNITSISNLNNNFKTFNKKHEKIYENESDESSDKYEEDKRNSLFYKRKKLIINGRETSDYERFWYNTLNAKLSKEKKERNKKRQNIKIKYNEKVFSRNNQILLPNDLLKKHLTNSTEKNNSKKLKNLLNSLSNSKITIHNFNNSNFNENKHLKKTNNEKILKKIIDLNNELHEFKYFAIADLINKEINLDKKINEIENKLTNDHKKLIIKNIIFEKLDKAQEESINNEENNEESINLLISNADKIKNKKNYGFVEKRFTEELKKLEKLKKQDTLLNKFINEHNNYYIWKQNNIKTQEEKIKTVRKKLSKSTKKIMKLADIIYNKKTYIWNTYKFK